MVIISLFCSLHNIHKRLYFYYYLNKWLNLVCAVSKSSHAFFYTAGFCCASFKTFCMFLLICVYSMFLNNVHLSGELWEINYVDTVCLYYRMFVVTSFRFSIFFFTSVKPPFFFFFLKICLTYLFFKKSKDYIKEKRVNLRSSIKDGNIFTVYAEMLN